MRDRVFRFAAEMERVLKSHDGRSGWEDENSLWLLARLQEETGELSAAIIEGHSPTVILREAADVANFAMMLADNHYGLSIEDVMKRAPKE